MPKIRAARFNLSAIVVAGTALAFSAQAQAQGLKCPVTHDKLAQALKQSVNASGGPDNGGLPVNEWAAVVNRSGVVCAVAYSGKNATSQWPGSRAIAVEKANTANAFSLKKYAISTANLWAQSQPGGFLYGANASNPPLAKELYAGKASDYGTDKDPLIGKKPGGVIIFGGGLALYTQQNVVGGLGASGNTSCADHNIAWRVRQKLGLDHVLNGPSPQHNDAIIYDVGKSGKSQSGWGHPTCGHHESTVAKQIGSGVVKIAQGESAPAPETQGMSPANAPPASNPNLTRQGPAQHQETLPKSLRQ